MTETGNSPTFPDSRDHVAWIVVYSQACLSQKNAGTADVYQHILRDFLLWSAESFGSSSSLFPQLTRTMVEKYLNGLGEAGYSLSHCVRVKSVLSNVCQWLIDEQGVLKRNPAHSLELPAQQVLAPRVLSEKQRILLRTLVEQTEDLRGEALFALGSWAGCRVSDVAYLLLDHTHVGPKIGWVHVGYKGGKFREIDLLHQARRPLFENLQHGGRDPESPSLFTSQRSQQLAEAGIHHWFRAMKQRARADQWENSADLSFQRLRHDFAHRAREAGWTREEIASYLGHVTKKGILAIQTTARYTQANQEQVKNKQIKG